MLQISASVLAANHVYIARDVILSEKQGVDWVHVDITDGQYTDNLTFGPKTVQDLRKVTSLPIDVHLGIFHQERFIKQFSVAGADMITLQFESCLHPLRTIDLVKRENKKVCMAFSPTTEFEQLKFLIKYVDQINILGVEPGFGNQKFHYEVIDKINSIREHIDGNNFFTKIAVDGGLNEENIMLLKHSGIDVLIMGTMIFNNSSIIENIKKIKSYF